MEINLHDVEKLAGFVYGYEKPKKDSEDMRSMAAAIEAAGGFINDHNRNRSYANELEQGVGAIVLLKKGEIAMWFGGGSCLNEAYIAEEDGLPHLSRWSNGGTIDRGSIKPLQEDIDRYNESVCESSKIVDWVEVNF